MAEPLGGLLAGPPASRRRRRRGLLRRAARPGRRGAPTSTGARRASASADDLAAARARPAPGRGQPGRRRAGARRGLGAGRRPAGPRGARPARPDAAALRPAADLGDRVRPDARRADRRLPVRGLGRPTSRTPSGCSPPARSRSTRATTTARSARWPGVTSPSMWMWCLRGPGQRRPGVLQPQRGPRQGAADGRLQRRRCITRLRWMRDVLGPVLSEAVAPSTPATTRWTSRRSSPRCCRWATRATTATAPAR